MSIHLHLSAWCQHKGISLADLSRKTGVDLASLQNFQKGEWDPPLSTITTMAQELEVPISWLHSDPRTIQRLWNDPDDDNPELPDPSLSDPIFQRMIDISREYPDIFISLTSILHHGDPKLIRAAQINLQSLLKQARPTTLPWGSRPPGHFEPPSD
ncbi:MAG: helix-turn-helix domain-containing protein [Nitrospirales bacterium]|nr:helix-turn-helix domain-containing protein [Nitrospirales bacterium]